MSITPTGSALSPDRETGSTTTNSELRSGCFLLKIPCDTILYIYSPNVTSPMQFRLKASPVSSGAAKGIVIATVLAAGLIGAYLYRDHIRSSILNSKLLCAGVYCCGMELFAFILA